MAAHRCGGGCGDLRNTRGGDRCRHVRGEGTQRAQVCPADFRDRLRADIDVYVSEVVRTEWPRMIDRKELSPRGTELLAALRTDVAQREPKNELEA